MDLVSGWGTQYFDNFNQLVNTRITREYGLTEDELGDDTAYRPHIDSEAVVSRTEYQFRGSVVPRADVAHVGLTLLKSLG